LEVCKAHGGGSKAARLKAAQRIEEEQARKALARFGEPVPVTNALEALQKRAGRIEAFANFLEEQIFAIKVEDWRYKSAQDLEQIHGLVQLFTAQQDRCTAALAGLAAVFKALGIAVSTDAQQAAYQVFSRKLTIIPGQIEKAA